MLERRIESIKVRNYRSLADVEVQLEDLTVLVGENGSGKSNLVDVLRFVRDALTKGLDAAIMERGGFKQIIHQKAATQEIEITLKLHIDGELAVYILILEEYEFNSYRIQRENFSYKQFWFSSFQENEFSSSSSFSIKKLPHNLILPLISDTSRVTPSYDFLTKLSNYHIHPEQFRAPQKIMRSTPMAENGENMLSTLQEILAKHPRNALSIAEFISRIVPSIVEENPIKVEQFSNFLITRIQHENGLFDLSQESDGTLRVLGILTALYQMPYLPFIGTEEPELMIHPQAMGLLCDALRESSSRSQILVTTHSPDLISLFEPASLRVVELVDGETKIDKIKAANLIAINKKLFSGGDLLRIGALGRA